MSGAQGRERWGDVCVCVHINVFSWVQDACCYVVFCVNLLYTLPHEA